MFVVTLQTGRIILNEPTVPPVDITHQVSYRAGHSPHVPSPLNFATLCSSNGYTHIASPQISEPGNAPFLHYFLCVCRYGDLTGMGRTGM